MNSNFLTDNTKLKNIHQSYEKQLYHIILTIDKFDNTQNIYKLKLECDENRYEEVNIVRKEVGIIFQFLNNVKRQISSESNNFDLKIIKSDMISIQEKLVQLKKKHSAILENLVSEEIHLTDEIQKYETLMIEWNKPTKVDKTNFKQSYPQICVEVNDFFDYVAQTGGYENGWTLDDHNEFLKIRNKCKSTRKLIKKMHALLPDKSEYEIEVHEKWYVKYLELKTKKLEAIKKWRSEKIIKKTSDKEVVLIESKPIVKINDRETMKAKLEEWKKEREFMKVQETTTKMINTLRKKDMESEKQKRKEEVKNNVSLWKQNKEQIIRAEKEERELIEKFEKKYKEREANKIIKQFQSKDDSIVQKRRIINTDRAKSVEVTSKRKFSACRDPTRLLKPTQQWINRSNPNDAKEVNNNVNFIKHVKKLGVPEWRKTMD